MNIGGKANKALLGNLILYLAEKCAPLGHPKLLKLLYLIDQESTMKRGYPMTWLSYKVWSLGPVSEDVYFSKNSGCNKFSEYVKFVTEDNRSCKIISKPKIGFDDSEFSDSDIDLIEGIIARYGDKTSKQLIKVTHSEDGLWSKFKKLYGLKFTEDNKTSDVEIDFSELIKDDKFKQSLFLSDKENTELHSVVG
jgi:Uncharacterized phage-associated protein